MTFMCVAAANYLIELTNGYNADKPYADKISMTCKRLQKLLYFSDAEYMKKNQGQSMFSDDFYAWSSGPVIPSVYYKFMQYQTGEMYPLEGKHTPITEEMKTALKRIFDITISLDTDDLVEKSHVVGGPWHKVFNNNESGKEKLIPKADIYDYYINREVICI